MKNGNVGQVVPDNQIKCHSKLDLESHHMLLRNDEILNQVQDDRRSGFTLIELLVVVLIIGILAAIALPQYQLAVEKNRASQLYVLLLSLHQAQHFYYLQHGEYAMDFKKLDIKFPYNDQGDAYWFDGGGYNWKKFWEASGVYAGKHFQNGYYALQINYASQERRCMAYNKGYAICQSLGYTTIASNGSIRVDNVLHNITYYKKP